MPIDLDAKATATLQPAAYGFLWIWDLSFYKFDAVVSGFFFFKRKQLPPEEDIFAFVMKSLGKLLFI